MDRKYKVTYNLSNKKFQSLFGGSDSLCFILVQQCTRTKTAIKWNHAKKTGWQSWDNLHTQLSGTQIVLALPHTTRGLWAHRHFQKIHVYFYNFKAETISRLYRSLHMRFLAVTKITRRSQPRYFHVHNTRHWSITVDCYMSNCVKDSTVLSTITKYK